jgi:CRP/FNR family transcriptional regulator
MNTTAEQTAVKLFASHDKPNCGIGAFLSDQNFAELKKIMYPKRAGAGSYLFWEGDPADYLYYIVSGAVKLVKTTDDGKDMIVSLVQAGDLIMEIDGKKESKHQMNAIVMMDAEIGVIQRRDLEIILFRNGEFALEFFAWMNARQQMMQAKMRDLLLYGKSGALASTLLRLCNSCGVATPDGIRIGLKLTNTELGEMIGATRESVNRMLSDLKASGVIANKQGYLIVKKLSELKTICHCPEYPVCAKEICRI